jgi:lipopolysaccharide transport system permease protein
MPRAVEEATPGGRDAAGASTAGSATAERVEIPSRPVTTEVVIRPARGWAPLNLRERWDLRELLYLLVWRNVKVRYKQTALGAAWAVIPSVLTMVVFTVIFGRLGRLSSDGSPYALFSFCALVPWTFFSNTVTLGSSSLIENERLVTKVYFPRLLIPLSATLSGLLDLAVSFALLLVLSFAFGVYPDLHALAVVPLAVLATVASFAVGLTLSALNVFYRDIRYVIAFLIQFWLFATPVAYSSSIVPEQWRPFYGLNPMTGVVDGFRWAMLDGAPAPVWTLPVSVVSTALVLLAGLYYFRRVEDSFADVV